MLIADVTWLAELLSSGKVPHLSDTAIDHKVVFGLGRVNKSVWGVVLQCEYGRVVLLHFPDACPAASTLASVRRDNLPAVRTEPCASRVPRKLQRWSKWLTRFCIPDTCLTRRGRAEGST